VDTEGASRARVFSEQRQRRLKPERPRADLLVGVVASQRLQNEEPAARLAGDPPESARRRCNRPPCDTQSVPPVIGCVKAAGSKVLKNCLFGPRVGDVRTPGRELASLPMLALSPLVCRSLSAVSWPAHVLCDNEEVGLCVRPHWIYLVGPVAATVAAIAACCGLIVARVATVWHWVALGALVVALVWLLGRYANWSTTRLAVTNLRVMERKGLFTQTVREIPIWSITNFEHRRGLLRRLVGAGDLLLQSGGAQSAELFSDLPHPDVISAEIYRQVSSLRQQSAGPAPTSIPAQIDQLDYLRRRGVLSEEEFQAKKAQLLGRL